MAPVLTMRENLAEDKILEKTAEIIEEPVLPTSEPVLQTGESADHVFAKPASMPVSTNHI